MKEEEESDRETERWRDGWRVMTRRMEDETGETRASKAITHLRRLCRHPRVLRLPPAALALFHLLSPPPGSSHAPSVPPAVILQSLNVTSPSATEEPRNFFPARKKARFLTSLVN